MSAISQDRVARHPTLAFPRADLTVLVLTISALATVIMLQATRVLVSYLVVVVGQGNRSALERDALLVFGASVLSPIIIWLAGSRLTLILTASLIALVRIVLQFWTQPDARLILAGAIVILWGWLTVTMLVTSRDALAVGLAAGLALDVGIRVGFLTLDLPWNNDAAAAIVTVVLAVVLLAVMIPAWTTSFELPSTGGLGLSLFAIGPGLALFHFVGGNLGLAQTKTDLGFPAAMSLLGFGLAAGLLGSAVLINSLNTRSTLDRLLIDVAIVAVGGIGLWLFWENKAIAPIALPVVAAANVMLIGIAATGAGGTIRRGRVSLPAIWFTLGMLLQVAVLFYYYDASGRTLYLAAGAVLLAAGALIGALTSNGALASQLVSRQHLVVLAAPIVVLVLVIGWQYIRVSNPTTGSPLPATFTVMTYNLQDGFAADNSFDLQAQASVIAAAHPDVVVLQEVSRGWLVTSGADEALWLSHRLDMPIYFGGNSDDGLWGNAILARAPVSGVQEHHFTVTQNLKRGTIEAQVPTANGDFWVVGTHLDNPGNADAIRIEQTQQLLSNLDGRTPAIVMGDFNADPGTEVLHTFSLSGFNDPGVSLLPNVYTTTDQRRIDYILVPNDFQVESMRVVDSQASDHKPVVAVLTLGPR